MRQQLKLYLLALSFVLGVTPKTLAQSTRAALDGTFMAIDVPGALATACNGVADDFGELIAGRFTSSDGVVHGFLRQGQDFFSVDFPDPGTNFTSANGIAANGDVVGSFDTNGGGGCLNPGSGTCQAFDLGEFGFLEITGPPGTRDLVALGQDIAGLTVTGAYTDLGGGRPRLSVRAWFQNG